LHGHIRADTIEHQHVLQRGYVPRGFVGDDFTAPLAPPVKAVGGDERFRSASIRREAMPLA